MLDAQSVDSLRLSDVLAHGPQAPGLLATLRQYGVADRATGQSLREQRAQCFAQFALVATRRQFDQQVPGACRQGRMRPRDMLAHQAKGDVGDQFAGRQRRSKARLKVREQANCRCR